MKYSVTTKSSTHSNQIKVSKSPKIIHTFTGKKKTSVTLVAAVKNTHSNSARRKVEK